MTEPQSPQSTPPHPDATLVRAMLEMLGIAVDIDDPRLPTLVREMEGQLTFAHAIDAVLADIPAEAVASAVGAFDPAWTTEDAEVTS